ncbi:hypothetical protein FGF04_06055 [Streptomyces apricus]|uniref:Uncharacterized protein n=1 Tax=Streptomyces apricus TaxID=1828112 RepID=A0A5B0BJW6_9ACTN|nr:hypothetical protein FGF04_06055 [Streptomyces apricus]
MGSSQADSGRWPTRRGPRPTFPRESREVTDDPRSYESTRCAPWPANSFMVSVTDPVGGTRCVLAPIHVNTS